MCVSGCLCILLFAHVCACVHARVYEYDIDSVHVYVLECMPVGVCVCL